MNDYVAEYDDSYEDSEEYQAEAIREAAVWAAFFYPAPVDEDKADA